MAGLGTESFLRLRKEAVWGTNPASGMWTIPITGESLAMNFEEFESETIAAGVARDAILGSVKKCGGTISGHATYNLLDHFLYAALGKVVNSTPTGGTNARDHWFEPDTTVPSLTAEVNRGDIEANDEVFSYVGLVCKSLEITVPDRGLWNFVAEFIGKQERSAEDGRVASGTKAGDPLTPQYILSSAAGTTPGGSIITGPAADLGAYCIRGMTFRIEREFDESYCVGGDAPNQPFPGWLSFRGEFQIEFKDLNVYNAFVAQTVYTGAGTFNKIIAKGGICEGTLKYEIGIHCNSYRWVAPSTPFIDRRGKLVARCPFVGFGNAGTGAVGTANEISSKQPIAIRTRNINTNTADY